MESILGRVSKILVLSLLVVTMGCAPKSSSSNSPVNPDPNVKTQDASKDYVEVGELNVVRTNQELSSVKTNQLSIKGQGTKSTYTFQYKFNSGNADNFKLMAVKRNLHSTGCSSVSDAKVTLSSGGKSKDINLVTKEQIQPNTEYVLELSLGKTDCSELELNYDIVAWADINGSLVDPNFASVCQGQKIQSAAFFPQRNFMTVYNAGSRKEFVGNQTYCGEKVESFKQITCSTNGLGMSDVSTVTCEAKTDSVNRGYEVVSNHKLGTASLTCSTDGAATYQEEFKDCRELILDLNQYAKLP